MKLPIAVSVIVSIALLLSVSSAGAKAPAPEGRTYFIQVMGLDDAPYEVGADCLTFGATEACSLAGTCLRWERLESPQAGPGEGTGFGRSEG